MADLDNKDDLAKEIQKKLEFLPEELLLVAFEPFSFIIIDEINKLRTRKERNRLYESILRDERTSVINKSESAITSIFPNHNTRDYYWMDTFEMSVALNNAGIDVCFLPEDGDVPKGTKRADAIIKVGSQWKIADFKYFVSYNDNTLSENLIAGFQQANVVVLKIQNANIGVFRDAIEYLKRNKKRIGDILLINEYNKVLILSQKQLNTDRYKYLFKGFIK